jgi:hypothetical protein
MIYKIFHVGMMMAVVVGSVAGAGCGLSSTTSATDGAEVDLSETRSELAGTDRLSQIAVWFETGGDDKRSDSQVFFNVTINGFSNQYSAGGVGPTWGNNTTTGWFFGNLPTDTRNQDISDFFVTWAQGRGGFIQTGDNWNMQSVTIWVFDTTLNSWQFKGQPGGNPLQRFTGNVTSWSWGWLL